MRRIEYSDFQTKTDEKKVEPELKFEDTSLPFFSKEVPETSKKSEEEGIVTVNHVWNDVETPWVRIKTIHFLKDEELENLFSMNVRDGVERASVKKQGFTYVLRKVVKKYHYEPTQKKVSLETILKKCIRMLKYFTLEKVNKEANKFVLRKFSQTVVPLVFCPMSY